MPKLGARQSGTHNEAMAPKGKSGGIAAKKLHQHLCHAHKFLWFPCMGLCSVMSIDLTVFFLRRLAPPMCPINNQISFCCR